MATIDPYANLAQISEMQKQALEDLINGRLVGEGLVPTMELTQRILQTAPKLYELYGESLGEDWLKHYLPAPGSTISYPLRQALQEYEQAMAPQRGVTRTEGAELADQYKTPAGTPTLNTQAAEASHTAWRLGQFGKWYNPVTKQIEVTPMVKHALTESAIPIYGAAGGAPSLAGIDYNRFVNSLSADNPAKKQIQEIVKNGYVPTINLVQQAMNWENQKAKEAAKGTEPGAQEIRDALAALAAEYTDPMQFQQHLMQHYVELVPVIGESAFRDLYTNAAQWVGKVGQAASQASAQNKSNSSLSDRIMQFYRNTWAKQAKTAPDTDAIGEFIQQMRSAGIWPVTIGGGASK